SRGRPHRHAQGSRHRPPSEPGCYHAGGGGVGVGEGVGVPVGGGATRSGRVWGVVDISSSGLAGAAAGDGDAVAAAAAPSAAGSRRVAPAGVGPVSCSGTSLTRRSTIAFSRRPARYFSTCSFERVWVRRRWISARASP